MKKKVLIGIAVLFVISVVLINVLKSKEKPIEVTIEQVKYDSVRAEVSASGRIKPLVLVDISSDQPGRLIKLNVKEGDSVKRGQVLCILDAEQHKTNVTQLNATKMAAEAKYEMAKAEYAQAESDYERNRALFEKGLISKDALQKAKLAVEISKSALDASKTEVERAKAALLSAEDSYSKTIIKSPIDGVVSKLLLEEGEMVIVGLTNIQGTVIMQVADLSVMEAEVEVDETEVKDLELNQEALIEVDAIPDTFLKGRISEIGISANVKGTGTQEEIADFPVRIVILEKHKKLRPGMSCEARIITAKKESVLVAPISSIVKRDSIQEEKLWAEKNLKKKKKSKTKSFEKKETKEKIVQGIYVVENGFAKFKSVKTGISDKQKVEIIEGLSEKDSIITGPHKILRELKSGQMVIKAKEKKE